MLGRTVQIYTTGLCKMNCPHCGSRRLRGMPNMTLDTFRIMVRALKWLGVERVELFANDPLLHPQIGEQVEILNESGIEYAILTVGASPHDPEVRERFFWVMKNIDKKRGSFVFSVDYTKETAEKILSQTTLKESSPYAFKAKTFWWLVPLLRAERIPVRINVVISRYNIDEVTAIIERAARIGFATSFCFV